MSETTTHNPSETLAEPHSGLMESVNDPTVSLGDLLKESGFEGLPPEGRLTLIEHATIDDYMTALDAVHRKVAPDYSHEFHPEAVKFANPSTGEVSAHAARPEERAGIMGHALGAAKQVVQKYRQEGGSVDEALQRCGNLAAFGVALAHNYKDGNGRAGRTLGELIHNGYDSNSADSVADLTTLSTNRPDTGFRINSYVPTGEWSEGRANQDPLAFLDTVAALDVPLDGTSYALAARQTFTTPRM
jgi:hypothetical protein